MKHEEWKAAWDKWMNEIKNPLPSCPSCEHTREIIAARLNQSVTNDKPEVADALREILEAIRTP